MAMALAHLQHPRSLVSHTSTHRPCLCLSVYGASKFFRFRMRHIPRLTRERADSLCPKMKSVAGSEVHPHSDGWKPLFVREFNLNSPPPPSIINVHQLLDFNYASEAIRASSSVWNWIIRGSFWHSRKVFLLSEREFSAKLDLIKC